MRKAKARRTARDVRTKPAQPSVRERVLNTAFAQFRKRGFAAVSTLDIATQAHVSKRDLYAQFGSKHAILVACIEERAQRMRQPLSSAMQAPETKAGVVATLAELGASILHGVCNPDVLTVYRLAIAESDSTPEIARALDARGRQANHQLLAEWLARVQEKGLIPAGSPAAMTERFIALLWGDLLVRLLLRVRDAPTSKEIEGRARNAAEAVLEWLWRRGESPAKEARAP
jgi:AcrR family transcriptional regulator